MLALASTLALALAGDSKPAPMFAEPIVPVDSQCDHLVAADVDADGNADALTTAGSALFTVRGDGAGGFLVTHASFTSHWIHDFSVFDADQDGDLDAVLVDLAKQVRLSLNPGDGSFGSAAQLLGGSGTVPKTAEARDLDFDGIADLVIAGAEVAVRRGFGGGEFAPAALYPLMEPGLDVAFGDYDGDSRIDLAVASMDAGEVRLFTARPDATLIARGAITTVASPHGVATADFDGDAFDDLLIATTFNGAAIACRGTPSLLFQVSGHLAGATLPRGQLAVDLDGDAISDALLTDVELGGSLHIAHGDGAGGLGSPVEVAIGSGPAAVAAADFDSDGRCDVLVSGGTTNAGLHWVATNPEADDLGTLIVDDDSKGFRPVDLEPDGDSDIVVAYQVGSNHVAKVYSNDGANQFMLASTTALGMQLDFPTRWIFSDYDGDGKIDLCLSSLSQARVYLGTGAGLAPNSAVTLFANLGSSPKQFAVADVGGDARPELVLLGDHALTYAINVGQVGTLAATVQSYGALDGWQSLGIGNADADARAELVVGKAGTMHLLDIDPAGFTEVATFATSTQGTLTLADVEGDGDVDVIAGENGPLLRIHHSLAPGVYGPETVTSGGQYLEIADLDGDGVLDFLGVVAGDGIRVTRTTAEGWALPPEYYSMTQFLEGADSANGGQPADFDGDGDLDLAVLTDFKFPPRIHLIENVTNPALPAGGGIAGTGCLGSHGGVPTISLSVKLTSSGLAKLAVAVSGAAPQTSGIVAFGTLPAAPAWSTCGSYLAAPWAAALPIGPTSTYAIGTALLTANVHPSALPKGLAVQALFPDPAVPQGFHATPAAWVR